MSIHKVFSNNLRDYCLSRGTIADACKGMEINRQQFNRYLSGTSLPNAATLSRICSYFGIRDSELFRDPESTREPQRLTEARSEVLRERVVSQSNFSQVAYSLGIVRELRHLVADTPSSELDEGYYFCYFPSVTVPNMIVRSLMRIKRRGSLTEFKRITLAKSATKVTNWLSTAKHTGYKCSDADVSYFVGKQAGAGLSLSLLVVQNRPLPGTQVFWGLGLIQGFSDRFSCHFCMERLDNREVSLKKYFKDLGMIELQESTLKPAVMQLFANSAGPKHIGMPTLREVLKKLQLDQFAEREESEYYV